MLPDQERTDLNEIDETGSAQHFPELAVSGMDLVISEPFHGITDDGQRDGDVKGVALPQLLGEPYDLGDDDSRTDRTECPVNTEHLATQALS